VKNGKIIAEGFHKKAGADHAEIIALKKAGKKAKDATLYVTLEPCNHYGKTPPCTQAILKAGIKKVIIGMKDPSSWGHGGANFLEKNGVEIEFGRKKIEKACRELNQIWLKNVKKKLPYITLKIALDKNGSMISAPGKKWITGPSARREVMKIRAQHDAILVGAGTIKTDKPRLTVRGIKVMKQPKIIVFDPRGRLSYPRGTVIKNLKEISKLNVTSILVEGGPYTAQKFLEAGLVDRVMIFQHNAKKTPPTLFEENMEHGTWNMEHFGKDTLFSSFLREY
jgi:diaminohydroxyphosphoribosylaminopyrimidine deaminase/5-amino-6-(5-phosphoribosylamino)uracil reductase